MRVAAAERDLLVGVGLEELKTLTARAKTSAAIDKATIACNAMSAFAQRASGMVSVGENAITLVTLR